MKLVNPIGRSVSKLETGANLSGVQPLGCICSSGSKSLAAGFSCADCACECDNGKVNRDANFKIAKTKRNYVNK